MWGVVWILSETKPHSPLRLVDQTLQGLEPKYRVSSGKSVSWGQGSKVMGLQPPLLGLQCILLSSYPVDNSE